MLIPLSLVLIVTQRRSFPLKAEVERRNISKLLELPGEARVFKAMDFYGHDIHFAPIGQRQGEQLLERLIVAKEVVLKVSNA